VEDFWKEHWPLLYVAFIATLGVMLWLAKKGVDMIQKTQEHFRDSLKDLYEKHTNLKEQVDRLQGEHNVIHKSFSEESFHLHRRGKEARASEDSD
jgi:predicted  nucleic acid-binding Zn-ribbon protein